MSADRITPSGIAEETYQAGRARRYPPIAGIPDRRATWKPEADPKLLWPIVRAAFDAYLLEIAPPAQRAAIAVQLDADLERRFPADDMIVLERYALTRSIDMTMVDVGGVRPMVFRLPAARRVPNANARFAHMFTAIVADGCSYAEVPEKLLPIFDRLIDAHLRRDQDFADASSWPARFHHEHKRRPTWGEIEDAFPRIGAWLASKRES